jgi:flagellar hook protein FlgE
MLRSLYAGVSGLKNHQTKMDVVGNNIANVNTVGFKASRVTFQDIYSQTLKPASAPTPGGLGGTNPQQVGLGVSLGIIDILHTRGATEYTGAALDISIDGDGFFCISDGTKEFYTRAGNFGTDNNSMLVNSDGLHVMGFNMLTIDDPAVMQPIVINDNYFDVSISSNGDVVGINTITQEKEVIAKIVIANFNNQNALEKSGNSLYSANLNSGAPEYGFPGSNGVATLSPASLEMSNVDLAKEFTDMIVTQRGFQANSRVITTSDQLLEELVNLKR